MEKTFKQYVAAVNMAQIASGGSGDLNHFDHVAKDLHQPGFDDLLDKLSIDSITKCRMEESEEIWKLARKYQNT